MTEGTKEESPLDFSIPKWVWGPALVLSVLWVAYPICAICFGKLKLQDLGLFGDMYGAFNPLISVAGLLGVLWALHLQREQFRATLQDMKDNADATKQMAKAASAQARALGNQNRITIEHIKVLEKQVRVEKLNAELAVYSRQIDTWLQAERVNQITNDQRNRKKELERKVAEIERQLGQVVDAESPKWDDLLENEPTEAYD